VCAAPAAAGGVNRATDASCGFTVVAVANVKLSALANNGGPTLTRLPQATSALVNKIAAGNCAPGVDQRGLPRPGGALCEVGAVERQ
jgi:hypothetical protein